MKAFQSFTIEEKKMENNTLSNWEQEKVESLVESIAEDVIYVVGSSNLKRVDDILELEDEITDAILRVSDTLSDTYWSEMFEYVEIHTEEVDYVINEGFSDSLFNSILLAQMNHIEAMANERRDEIHEKLTSHINKLREDG